MTIEQIKENLSSSKVEKLLVSDFEYLYRHTCEFAIEQYQALCNNGIDENTALLILPIASLSEILLPPEKTDHLKNLVNKTFENSSKITDIQIIDFPKKDEELLLSLIFFKNSQLDWSTIKEKQQLMTIEQKEIFLELYQQDTLQNECDFLSYTFQCHLDYLTIQELKKLNLQNYLLQDLSLANGYFTPETVINSGFQSEYIMTMKRCIKAYEEVRQSFPQLAKYIIPLAFLQKVLFTVNINQLKKINLNIKDKLWAEIKKIHPTIYKMNCS